MPKKTISARIPNELFDRLDRLATETGKDRTDLITEAIAQYLGDTVESVGDRLLTLEREVESLRGKFQTLQSS